jgi:hypothetical protein
VDGAAVTIIDGGEGGALHIEGSTVELTGLTLTGRASAWTGAGVSALSSTLAVHDSVISGATSAAHPSYGAYLSLTDSTWERVVFEDNSVSNGALGAFDGGYLEIVHCLFQRNGSIVLNVGGPDATIHNNLIVDNSCDIACVNLSMNTAVL